VVSPNMCLEFGHIIDENDLGFDDLEKDWNLVLFIGLIGFRCSGYSLEFILKGVGVLIGSLEM